MNSEDKIQLIAFLLGIIFGLVIWAIHLLYTRVPGRRLNDPSTWYPKKRE